MNRGTYVSVHTVGPTGQTYRMDKGFIEAIGDGSVTIASDKGYSRVYKLNSVALEKAEPLAETLQTYQSLGVQPQIKNKATGSGFVRTGSKVRFAPDSIWESRPARN